MRKSLFAVLALGALLALVVAGLASAGGNKPVTVTVGNLKLTAGGGFSPTVLPKNTKAPIALTAEGKIETTDGSHPPALKEALIETDKNGTISVKGYPTCRSGQLQAQDSSHAEAICKPALIGTGTTKVEIEFAESKPVPVSSKLLVFNGGESGGVVTLLIHAYITVPTPAAIVTTVKIKKIHHGPFGLLSTAKIPVIAGGSGSVTAFKLKIDKKYTYKGKKVSVLNLSCPTGKVPVHVLAKFADGTTASTEFIRTCTGKG